MDTIDVMDACPSSKSTASICVQGSQSEGRHIPGNETGLRNQTCKLPWSWTLLSPHWDTKVCSLSDMLFCNGTITLICMASENEGVVERLRKVLEIRLKECSWKMEYTSWTHIPSKPIRTGSQIQRGDRPPQITRNLGALTVERQRWHESAFSSELADLHQHTADAFSFALQLPHAISFCLNILRQGWQTYATCGVLAKRDDTYLFLISFHSLIWGVCVLWSGSWRLSMYTLVECQYSKETLPVPLSNELISFSRRAYKTSVVPTLTTTYLYSLLPL